MAATTSHGEGWRFRTGDPITADLTALKLLGGGKRYEAWVAWHERLFAPVVVKLLRPHLAGDERSQRMVASEGRALERLQHPVIVRSFGMAVDVERPHLVLEFLDGPRLSTLLAKYGPLSAEQLIPLGRQLCSALRFMAAEGWLHLDVKPANLVMTATPRLIDLSVARPIEAARQLVRPVGTRAYMAPEQCDPDRFQEIGPATDVWGLGVTLHEALTGRQAFPPNGSGKYPQLASAAPGLPPKAPSALVAAIAAALAPRPEDRPDAGELDALLEPMAEWSAKARRRIR